MIVEIGHRDLSPPLEPYWWLAHLDLVRRDLAGREGRRSWGIHHAHPAPRSRRVAELKAARDRTIRGASMLDAYPSLRRDGEAVLRALLRRAPAAMPAGGVPWRIATPPYRR